MLIVSLTRSDLVGLSEATAPRTALFQEPVDASARLGVVVYVAYFEDEFDGTPDQPNGTPATRPSASLPVAASRDGRLRRAPSRREDPLADSAR